MRVHVKSDDPELIYVTRPSYATNSVRIREAHGTLCRDRSLHMLPCSILTTRRPV